MHTLRTLGLALTLTLASGAALAQAPAATGEVVVSEEAREKFRAGVALLKDPDGARYEEAYLAFKAAYALSPSPNMLGNVGLCAMKLERDGEAVEAYEKYLSQGTGIDEADRKQMQTDLNTMKSTLATLRMTIPADASVIDERVPSRGTPVRNRYAAAKAGPTSLGVRAGLHRVTVTAPGFADQTFEIDMQPGQTVDRSITLAPPGAAGTAQPGGAQPGAAQPGGTTQPAGPAPSGATERPVPVGVWVGLGLTGALAIGTGVVGALALSNKSDFDAHVAAGDTTAAEDAKSSGQTLNITTDVLLGGTVVAGAVTAILFFTRPEVSASESASIHVVPTGTGVAVFGTF